MKPIVVITEDSAFANQAIPVPTIADMMCSALTGMTQQVINNIRSLPASEDPAFSPENMERDLFDALNLSFSKCLENAFPEMAGRPEISEQAIMEVENRIIDFEAAKIHSLKTEPNPTEE